MPVRQFVGAEAQGPAEQLVAEADAEERDPGRQRRLDQVDRPVGRPGVAGAVGEEHPVRFQGQHLVDRRGRRHHVHLDAPLGHPVWRHRLDAEVDRHHPEAGLAGGGDGVGLPGGDLVGQEGAGHLRLGPDPFQQGGRVGLDAGHADPHRPALAQVTGDGPGVHLAHADHVLGLQLLVQRTTGPPARRDPGGVADHVAGDPDPARLVVLVVPAGVADVRRGGHHDLAVVAGVGERLLVTRHPGGEHRLAEGLPHRSERPAAERAAVLQNEQSRWTGRGRNRTSGHDRPFLPHGTGLKGWLTGRLVYRSGRGYQRAERFADATHRSSERAARGDRTAIVPACPSRRRSGGAMR